MVRHRMHALMSATVMAGVVGLAGLAGCTAAPHAGVDAPELPDPAADRPVVALTYRMADDLASAEGTERVTFTPDEQVCELVFRAWPNKPATAVTGNALTVSAVSVGGTALPLDVQAAGAPSSSPGTLVEARLPSCSPAGTPITADLTFQLRLGERTDERVGYSSRHRIAWFGSAYPMLAWAPGVGWTRDPAVDVAGEMTTSQAYRLESMTVEAPGDDAVMGVGDEVRTEAGSRPGTTAHTFSADVVRDVTVSVGRFEVDTRSVDGRQITVALPPNARGSMDDWHTELRDELRSLSEVLGRVPTSHLWISVLPGVSEGVEYGAAIQFGNLDPQRDRWLVAHELAHMWFYGLVGNNQAEHPWLDESFATYAQEVVSPADTTRRESEEPVGAPMSYFAGLPDASGTYVNTVYARGGAALLRARDRVGEEEFDAALREYLRANAWGIATPDDVRTALQHLPEAVAALDEASAFRAD